MAERTAAFSLASQPDLTAARSSFTAPPTPQTISRHGGSAEPHSASGKDASTKPPPADTGLSVAIGTARSDMPATFDTVAVQGSDPQSFQAPTAPRTASEKVPSHPCRPEQAAKAAAAVAAAAAAVSHTPRGPSRLSSIAESALAAVAAVDSESSTATAVPQPGRAGAGPSGLTDSTAAAVSAVDSQASLPKEALDSEAALALAPVSAISTAVAHAGGLPIFPVTSGNELNLGGTLPTVSSAAQEVHASITLLL